jgi:citrate lyase subunit beta / citryl-CoA lyase
VTARSYLYVPGNEHDKLSKALAMEADALIVDLEDAVAPTAKNAARLTVARWLDTLDDARGQLGSRMPQVWVRINPAGPDGSPQEQDLATAAHPAVTGIVQAKAATATHLAMLAVALDEAEATARIGHGTLKVAALVESAAALQLLPALAAAPRVCRLQLGEADLVADLGMEPGPEGIELMAVRTSVVVASAAAGIEPPVGSASTDLTNLDALRRGSETLRRLGFMGRTAIHPRQLAVINDVFTPTPEQEQRARALLDLYGRAVAAGHGVVTDDRGLMVDRAVIRTASNVVSRARLSRGEAASPEEQSGGERR